MTTIKLNDEIFKELHILKKSEWDNIGSDYKGTATFDKRIKTAFLPGYGTTLFFENKHFIIISDREPVKKFAIWRNHKVIGYCEITERARQKNNGANNAEFYIGYDPATKPENHKYSPVQRLRECKPPAWLFRGDPEKQHGSFARILTIFRL